jgi:hypothetical protein
MRNPAAPAPPLLPAFLLALLFALAVLAAPGLAQEPLGPAQALPRASSPESASSSPGDPLREENLFAVSLERIMALDGRTFALFRGHDELARQCRERCSRETEALDLAQAGFSATRGPALTALDQEYGPGALDRLQAQARVRSNRTAPPDLCGRCKTLARQLESPMESAWPVLVLENLLTRHPKYAGHPDLEMADGFRRAWRVPAKAQAPALSFDYPASWAEMKDMPSSVATLAANRGAGPGFLFVRLSALPPGADKLPPERALDQAVANELRAFPGYAATSSRKGELAGTPARVLTGDWNVKINNRAALVKMRSYWAVRGQTVIGLHLAAGAGKEGDFAARAAEAAHRLEPLFDRVAGSFKVEP